MPDARPLLRQPDFLKLWGGQAISQIGSHIFRAGLPLLSRLFAGAILHTFGRLYVVASLDGVLATLFDNSYRTYGPSLVGPGRGGPVVNICDRVFEEEPTENRVDSS